MRDMCEIIRNLAEINIKLYCLKRQNVSYLFALQTLRQFNYNTADAQNTQWLATKYASYDARATG